MSFPDEWTEKKFDDFATLQRGKDLPKQSRGEGVFPILGSNGICGYHSEFVSEGPGVVTGRSGSVGGSYYIDGRFWPLNTSLWVKDFHGNIPLFVHYFFQSFDFARFKAGVSVPTLNRNLFSNELVTIPPLPEQRSIAAVLAKIQEAIAAQQEIIDRTRELKKALMVKLFTEGLKGEATKETEIGVVPGSWDVKTVKECCTLIVDCPHSTPKFMENGVRVIRNVNLKNGFILDTPTYFVTDEDYTVRTRRATLREDDVIFSREAPVGEAGLVSTDARLCLGQRMMQFRTNKNQLNPRFLVYAIYSESVRKRLLSLASGVTAQHINVADMKSFKIPVPTISEQSQIVEAIFAIDTAIFAKQEKKESLQDLFKTMLHELMTGSIRTTGLA